MPPTSTLPSRPVVPSDLPADRLFIRAVTAHAVAAALGGGYYAGPIARDYWPKDAATLALIERSATTPATIGTSGWASTLAGTAIDAFIGSLQESAAAKLIAAAPRFDMPGIATVALPRASTTGTPQWIGEGGPIPVGMGFVTSPTLGPPKKLALIEAVTRELAETTVSGAESIISIILRDAMTRQLDLSVFSATAAGAQPAGILNGISATTGTTSGGANACLADLRALISAVVAGGGSGKCLFVSSPGRKLAIENYCPSLLGQVLSGAAIPDTTLICLDPNGFASMFGPDPEILASKETTLHYEDTTPLQLTTGAAGSAVLATPARSVFQTDSIAIRAVLRAAWIMRVPSAVSFITAPSW